MAPVGLDSDPVTPLDVENESARGLKDCSTNKRGSDQPKALFLYAVISRSSYADVACA